MKIYIVLLLGLILLPNLSVAQKRQAIGIKSQIKFNQITRINTVVDYLNNNQYEALISFLEGETISKSSYVRQHILNEMADIYSYNILDIEEAIKVDEQIEILGDLPDKSNYTLSNTGANIGSKKKVKNVV